MAKPPRNWPSTAGMDRSELINEVAMLRAEVSSLRLYFGEYREMVQAARGCSAALHRVLRMQQPLQSTQPAKHPVGDGPVDPSKYRT